MRIGLILGASGGRPGLEDLVDQIRRAEEDGFAAVHLSTGLDFDPLTVFALAGAVTQRIELVTGVIPTYPRHPFALAQQALTVQAATHGRLTLGIGLSHRTVIEGRLGLDYSRPVRHMREYLMVLNNLLAGAETNFLGEEYRVAVQVSVPGATKPPVIVAALGPAMLRLAGRLSEGTITWMGGLAYLRDVAIPTITAAAEEAGRPRPRIVAGLPICVTDDVEGAREAAARAFRRYGELPSYRATLERGGAAGPEEVVIAGNEAEVEAQMEALREAGVTDFAGSTYRAPETSTERTYEFLASLARLQGSRSSAP